jgi:UDP-N-acetylmuramate dehydrogenase
VTPLIREQVALDRDNTLRLPSNARFCCDIDDPDALAPALGFARERRLPLLVLGGGSNVVLPPHYPGLVLRMRLRGRELLEEGASGVVLRVAAGEDWHALVLHCHAAGWFGLENLALIPGTAGAAPIQNIGAYGVELARFVREVRAVDAASGAVMTLDREACRFGYRDSVFKRSHALVITALVLALPRDCPPCLEYAALAAELANRAAPSHADVLQAVMRVRRRRLPDPQELPNAGSFFKNPTLTTEDFAHVQVRAPGVVHWRLADGRVRLAAAWLVEQAGWKGRRLGAVGVHAEQALVLVNHGGGTAGELLALAARIAEDVRQRFAVTLEIEPAVC